MPSSKVIALRSILVAVVLSGLGCVARTSGGVGQPDAEPQLFGEPARSLPTDALDVVVFNVAKGRGRRFDAAIAELLPSAELVLLQEVVLPEMLEPLRAEGHSWLMARTFSFTARADEPSTGVATGSTARALTWRTAITHAGEPLVGTPKATLLSAYALRDRDDALLVVNLHGINFRPAPFLQAQLDALAPAIAGHHGPVILAGDFNTHHRRRAEALERFTASLGLQPAFADTDDDGRRRHLGRPLDHVFVRGLVVERAEVIRVPDASDHRPLRVRLRVP